jgi:ubiquinone/menaquinone biosynthesis C-methylase UbiE
MDTQKQRTTSIAYPKDVLPALRDISFVCPLCRAPVEVFEDGYHCEHCQKNYLLYAGIPDFRVFPDPYLTYEEDRERTDIVLTALNTHRLEDLLKHYWSFSDITPQSLRSDFIRSAMRGEDRAKRAIEIFEDGTFGRKVTGNNVLEVGSGTGNFLALASGCYRQVVGVDIAMRWLHLSRRRFIDRGLPDPPLVCCCAEFLPFPDDTFDLITSTSTLEFVNDQTKFLSECSRVVTNEGSVHINTANRFSITKDPYAQLWGVGYLPYSWQPGYVRRLRDATYKTRTLSWRSLKRLANRYFPFQKDVLPDIGASTLRELPSLKRKQVLLYRALKRLPFFSWVLRQFGPGWEIILQKKPIN